ncbi:MAG: cytochrome c3 family protein [Actinomycetes bacterium]|jgi:hypothetical protein|nr:cytochrome c3 family protein [Actinomycetes bacterium]
MKKKVLFVLAVTTVLVLAFSAVAMAKYAGAFNRGGAGNDADALVGYLSWDNANAIYARDTGLSSPQSTIHGGYNTTSVKCAVCHSPHRATADDASTGYNSIEDHHLTNAGSCLNCHTTWGAGGSAKKIEAAEVAADRGPHHGLDCTMCHGGIHGGGASKFYMMDAWMLGGDSDTAIETAVANGNWSIGEGSPWASAPTSSGRNWARTNFLPLPASGVTNFGTDTVTETIDGVSRTWATNTTGYGYWWVNGDGRYWIGTGAEVARPVPAATATSRAKPAGVSGLAFSAAKAMATGYTCARCHENSHFAVNRWGYAEDHEVRQSTPSASLPITGHGTGAWMHDGGNPSCSPCHPDGAAGGYRLVTDSVGSGGWGDPTTGTGAAPATAAAYGCDQCHDMVGKATDSTAWPHGNRAIDVYEWSRPGAPGTAAVKTVKTLSTTSHNIWMYSYDIGVPGLTTNTQWEGTYNMPNLNGMTQAQWDALPAGPATTPGTQAYYEDLAADAEGNANGSRYLLATNGNPNYWNADFKVIENAVANTASNPGVINDSTCLKCHIAIDGRSVLSRTGTTATTPVNPGGASSHHHYFIDKDGKLSFISESGNSWNIGTEITDANGAVSDLDGQSHYIGHAQLIYLFK